MAESAPMLEKPPEMLETPAETPPEGSEGAPAAQKSVVREYAEALTIALVLAIIIRTFLIQAYKIPSGSMEPTLLVGDHILVNKLIYGLRIPDSILNLQVPGMRHPTYLFRLKPVERGDVVVLVFPLDRTKDFIKRVIGTPGDLVQVRNAVVWVNGKPIDDPHAHFEVPPYERSGTSPRDNFGPVTVPPGKVLVMGDNRDRSYDSRFWGFVDQNDIEGRALVIYWSWDSDGASLIPVRWSRFGMVVH
ncbi:MAG TPA: signal peptidase I [Candidatus Binataceae bacterium]|nr:signal peptidase I [Candidatus Binataceae bacterium]